VTERTAYGFASRWPSGRRDATVLAPPATAHAVVVNDGIAVVDGIKYGRELTYVGRAEQVVIRRLPVLDLPWVAPDSEPADEFADAFAAIIDRLPKQAQLGAFALFLMAFATGGKEFGEAIGADPDAQVALALLGSAVAVVLWPRRSQD